MSSILLKYSEFFQDDGGLKKVKDDFVKLGDELIEKAKEVKKEASFINPGDNEAIEKVTQQTKELTQARSDYNKLLKRFEALQKKQTDGTRKNTKAITAQSEAVKKRNRELRAVAKIQNTVTGSIENLRARLSLVTIAWSKLSEEELKNTRRGQRLVNSKKDLTAQLKRLEQATGDARRNVGNYGSALGKLRGSLVSVAQATGVTLGLFGAFRVIRNSVSIVRDFEKQNATLAGVLNTNKDGIRALTDDAQRLGSITVKTASEVAQLQTAYARLGFTQKEIINLTEATIDGSIALNSDLERTSKLVGAVVNSFSGLESTDAPKILETLSASTTKTALDFESLNVQLPIVAGAANAVGLTLEETVAVLGKLSDAGIDASSASTSFRNILIEAAKRGLDYREAIEQVRNSTDKLTTANELFGKRAAVSAVIVAENTEAVAELSKELDNASVVSNLVDNELNTLDGSLKLLTSAWEGYVLKLNDATNGGNALSNGIRFLAENLQTIFKVIGIATTSYIAYTVATKASNLATRAGIVINRSATVATNIKTAATQAATVAQRTFNNAVKANPIGLLVTLLATAVTAYIAFRDSVDESAKAQKRLNDLQDEGKKRGEELQRSVNSSFDRNIKQLRDEANLRISNGENSEKVNKELADQEVELTKTFIKESQMRIQMLEDEVRTEQTLFDQKRRARVEAGATGRDLAIEQRRINDLAVVNEAEIKQERINQARLNQTLIENQKLREQARAEANERRKKNAIKRSNELSILRRRLEDLQDASIENDEQREIAQAKRKFDREIKAIKGNSDVEIQLRNALENAKQEQITDIQEKYQKIRLDLLIKAQDIERSLIEDDTKRRIEIERAKTNALIKQIEANTEITNEKRQELIASANSKLQRFEDDIALQNKLKGLENEKALSEALIEQRRGEFKTQEEYERFKNAEFLKIQRKFLEDRIALLETVAGDEFNLEIEQLKAQLANLDIPPPPLNQWEKFVNDLRGLVSQVAISIERGLSDAVNKSKESLQDQQDAVDIQRERAEKGLTNTLAFEQKELAKRESEIIRREKRLANAQKLRTYWNAFNANLQSLKPGEDSADAIAKTLKDIGIIEGITSALASFGDGGAADDVLSKVPTDGRGITRGRSHQGRLGGIPVMIEGREGFLSSREMANLGKDNFYKIKRLASTGPLSDNFFSSQKDAFVTTMPTYATDPRLVKEMQDVKRAIENKPVSQLDVPQVVDGILRFTETIKTKHKTKRNHYKVQKPRL